MTHHDKKLATILSTVQALLDFAGQLEAEKAGLPLADLRKKATGRRIRSLMTLCDRANELVGEYDPDGFAPRDLDAATRIADQMELMLCRYFDPHAPVDDFFTGMTAEAWIMGHYHQGEGM